MNNIKVSLIASAVRTPLFKSAIESLDGTSVEYEVVFGGNARLCDMANFIRNKRCKYIQTADIKPAQVYELCRREAKGETIIWTADDAEYPNDVIGKAYKYWKEQENRKLVLSIQTRETGYNNAKGSLFNMKHHTFYGYQQHTPLMAPLGMMSREYLEELGGLDRRYVCGQYENDIVMRAYADGGSVEIFGNASCFIDIDHLGKSIMIGESTSESSFRDRPFAKGYAKDRQVLENSWCPLNEDFERQDEFEPYQDENYIYARSESNKGDWK